MYIIIDTNDIQQSLLSVISNPNLGAAPSVSMQLLLYRAEKYYGDNKLIHPRWRWSMYMYVYG